MISAVKSERNRSRSEFRRYSEECLCVQKSILVKRRRVGRGKLKQVYGT